MTGKSLTMLRKILEASSRNQNNCIGYLGKFYRIDNNKLRQLVLYTPSFCTLTLEKLIEQCGTELKKPDNFQEIDTVQDPFMRFSG